MDFRFMPEHTSRSRPRRPLALAALSLLAALTLARADNSPEASSPNSTTTNKLLTLADVKRISLERNWDLLAAKSEVDIATAQRIIAREFPNPTLLWSTAKINTDANPNSTASGNDLWHRSYDTIFAINQLFEVGGKRSGRQAS